MKAKREEALEAILAVDFLANSISGRRDDARRFGMKPLNSSGSSKSRDETTSVFADSSKNGRNPYEIKISVRQEYENQHNEK